MSAESLERLRAIVTSRPDLVAKLRPIPEREALLTAALDIAREFELEVRREDLEAAMREGHRQFVSAWLPYV